MVQFEVTRHADKPGAREFIAWLDANDGVVEIGITEEFAEFTEMLALSPALRTRNRGEMAAAEVLANVLDGGIDAGLLLFEDSDIRKANFLVRVPDNVLILSTSTFLHGLQRRHLIPDCFSACQAMLACGYNPLNLSGNSTRKGSARHEPVQSVFPVDPAPLRAVFLDPVPRRL
jgi:hypothetical protein